jgi:hypothetical protein
VKRIIDAAWRDDMGRIGRAKKGTTFRYTLPVKKEKPAPITIITDRL